jgi:hypothetical protein
MSARGTGCHCRCTCDEPVVLDMWHHSANQGCTDEWWLGPVHIYRYQYRSASETGKEYYRVTYRGVETPIYKDTLEEAKRHGITYATNRIASDIKELGLTKIEAAK